MADEDVERTPRRALSHDEAGRAAVENAQAARELRVRRFERGSEDQDLRESAHTIGQALRGEKPDIVRDMDIERRRQQRLEDRPLERQWKLYRKHPAPQRMLGMDQRLRKPQGIKRYKRLLGR